MKSECSALTITPRESWKKTLVSIFVVSCDGQGTDEFHCRDCSTKERSVAFRHPLVAAAVGSVSIRSDMVLMIDATSLSHIRCGSRNCRSTVGLSVRNSVIVNGGFSIDGNVTNVSKLLTSDARLCR